MSGELLSKIAVDIGYRPTDRKIAPETFEWMFLNGDSTKGFLEWFCDNITSKNILKDSEIQQFNVLKQDKKVLEGRELDEALSNIHKISNEEEESLLEREIEMLERELIPLKREEKLLSNRFSFLENTLSCTQKKTNHLSHLLSHQRDQYSKTIYQKICHRSEQIQHSICDIETCISQIVDLYASQLTSAQSGPFPSTSSFWNEYYCQEEEFTKQLRLYTRRMLETNNDDHTLTNNNNNNRNNNNHGNHTHHGKNNQFENPESSRYFWLNVSEPSNVCFKGVDTETYARHSHELSRLKSVFAASENRKTCAEIELARVSASVETIKLQLINSNQYSMIDVSGLKHKIKELTKRLSRVSSLVERNVNIVLPELYEEISKLQTTPIIWTDYNLKISRLYFQKFKLDKVIQQLLNQKARTQLLTFALNFEKKEHDWVYLLLTSYRNDTLDTSKKFYSRIEEMKFRNEHPTSRLLSNVLTWAYQILSGKYVANNASKIVNCCLDIANRIQQVKTNQDDQSENEQKELVKLQSSVSRLQSLLFKDCSGNYPVLSSQIIADACRKVEMATTQLATPMEAVLKNHASRTQAVSSLPKERQFERNLWVYYFGKKENAKILKAAFKDIQDKIMVKKNAESFH